MEPEEYPLPPGMSKVTQLVMHLMDPDTLELKNEDTDMALVVDHSPRPGGRRRSALPPMSFESAREKCMLVLDPLEEICKRLRKNWLCNLDRLWISNIEDHRFDYNFLHLRGTVFLDFPFVKATAQGGRYTVEARSIGGLATEGNDQLQEAAKLSLSRRPSEGSSLLGPPGDICEAEAAFLRENHQVFKCAGAFHFAHAPWRSCCAEQVRKRYTSLLDMYRGVPTNGVVTIAGHC